MAHRAEEFHPRHVAAIMRILRAERGEATRDALGARTSGSAQGEPSATVRLWDSRRCLGGGKRRPRGGTPGRPGARGRRCSRGQVCAKNMNERARENVDASEHRGRV